MYIQIQELSKYTRDPDKWEKDVEDADEMLKFVVGVARHQMHNGKYFVFEQPRHARSWGRAWMRRLANEDGVNKVDLDMCRFNLTLQDELGPGLAKKAHQHHHQLHGDREDDGETMRRRPPTREGRGRGQVQAGGGVPEGLL